MAGINSLKGLRNVNLTSVKEGAKRSAALTLLLSTVACTQDEGNALFIFGGGFLFIFGPSIVLSVIAGIYEHFFDPHVPVDPQDKYEQSLRDKDDHMYYQQ
jgi:hypothetical protein